MEINLTAFIGYSAALMSTINVVPEILKAAKTHHLGDVAWGMLILGNISNLMWIFYAIYLRETPLMISSVIIFAMSMILLYQKIIYSKQVRTA